MCAVSSPVCIRWEEEKRERSGNYFGKVCNTHPSHSINMVIEMYFLPVPLTPLDWFSCLNSCWHLKGEIQSFWHRPSGTDSSRAIDICVCIQIWPRWIRKRKRRFSCRSHCIHNSPLGSDKDSFSSSIYRHTQDIMSQCGRTTTDTRDHVEYNIKNVSRSNSMIIDNRQFSPTNHWEVSIEFQPKRQGVRFWSNKRLVFVSSAFK